MAKMWKHLFNFWTLPDTFSISIGHLKQIQNLKSKKPLATKTSIHAIKILDLVDDVSMSGQKAFSQHSIKMQIHYYKIIWVWHLFEIIQNLSHVFIYFKNTSLLVNFMSSTCVEKRLKHEIEIYSDISMLWK